MGSAFQQLVGQVHIHYLAGSFSQKRQNFSVDNSFRGLGANVSFLSKGPTLLKRQGLSLPLLSASFRHRPVQRKLRTKLLLRCCEAGAAEASPSSSSVEVIRSDDSAASATASSSGPSLRVPFDLSELQVVRSLQEAEKELLKTIAHPKPLPSAAATEAASAEEEPSSTEETASNGVHLVRKKKHRSTPSIAEEAPVQNAINEEALQFLDGDEEKGLLQQIWDIVRFAGPALGIWLSGPLMSLIDTAVVGNTSSLELAALGPGTVFCDQLCYVFMFLSVATSNLIATSLAKQDETGAAHHLSRLLFVALTCGIGMFFLTVAFAEPLIKGFTGPQNAGLVSAACSYVKIRGFAWPAVLVGMVAQSASLGMQDSWGPLKVLAVASFVNLSGDIVLCTCLGYGIAGAAWATMASQYIGGYLMLRSLERKGYSLALCVPSAKELLHMIEIAAPVLLTMLSKVSFYAFITFLSTSLGAVTLGAHQVMIGIYSTCTVSGEPLCQTAQSFMPALIQGENPNLKKAQMLLRSLLLIGALCGVSLGCFAISFPWVFPQVFTSDIAVINQMRAVTVPFFCALVITPPLLSLEGTLLAGRDLKFLSLSMVSCFIGGSALLMALKRLQFGLQGFWWTLACFQSARFLASYTRLKSGKSVLRGPEQAKKKESQQVKLD